MYKLCFADVILRCRHKSVLFEEAHSASAAGHALPFTGVPFMVLGWQVRECASGQPRKPRDRERAVSTVSFMNFYSILIDRA